MKRHTPGEWHLDRTGEARGHGIEIRDTNTPQSGKLIGVAFDQAGDEIVGNAELFRRAPKLLAIAHDFYAYLQMRAARMDLSPEMLERYAAQIRPLIADFPRAEGLTVEKSPDGDVAREIADGMFAKRKGHGGAPIRKRVLTHEAIQAVALTAIKKARLNS